MQQGIFYKIPPVASANNKTGNKNSVNRDCFAGIQGLIVIYG